MVNERLFLEAEIVELKEMISELDEDDIFERLSFESRLKNITQQLAKLPEEALAPKLTLTFQGKPVFGSKGIVANFASEVVAAFSDTFATLAAGMEMSQQGPLPHKQQNLLTITNTAIGSFGFEMELPDGEGKPLFPNYQRSRDTLKKLESILRLTVQGSDDEVAEAIEDIHSRAIKKVQEFMDLLVKNEAWCSLAFEKHCFRFRDLHELESASVRLQKENIHETTVSFTGEIQGVLPAGRSFEFLLSDKSKLIKGKIKTSIADPDRLNREWLHKPASIKLSEMKLGNGKPRYALNSLDDLIAS